MSVLLQYANRTVDVAAFQGARAGEGEVLLQQDLLVGDVGGLMITGIQKLAQRFLIRLLTEAGSILHLPEEGTQFMTEARQGLFRVQLDVEASFAEAMFDVEQQLKGEELAGDPPDERFDSAEIVSTSLAHGKVVLRVRLRAESGANTEFIVPVAATP